MSSSTFGVTARTIPHSSHDHEDGGRLSDRQRDRDLTSTYLKAGEAEWSGDFDIAPWSATYKFQQLDLGIPGFGFHGPTARELDGPAWKAEMAGLIKELRWYWQGDGPTRRKWYGSKASPVKGVRHLTVTMRPDHAMVLQLMAAPPQRKAVVRRLALRISEALSKWMPDGPTAPYVEVHLGESVPHFHPMAQVIRDGVLLLKPGKRERGEHSGFGLLGPGVLAMLRLTRAGLYREDPFATRALDRVQATKERPPLDWVLTCLIDDCMDSWVRSRPDLKARHAEVAEDYRRHLMSKLEASPFNHRGKVIRLERQLVEKDEKIAVLTTQMADLARQVAEMREAMQAAPAAAAPEPVVPALPQILFPLGEPRLIQGKVAAVGWRETVDTLKKFPKDFQWSGKKGPSVPTTEMMRIVIAMAARAGVHIPAIPPDLDPDAERRKLDQEEADEAKRKKDKLADQAHSERLQAAADRHAQPVARPQPPPQVKPQVVKPQDQDQEVGIAA